MSLDVNISEPDEFNCSELHSSINELAKHKEIDNFVYHVEYICGNGKNYISNVFRIVIKSADNENQQYSYIIKTLINTARQELFHELHEREVETYENIVKKYNEIQQHVQDDLQVIFPQMQLMKSEVSEEVLILDDMKTKGYETSNTLINYELSNYHETQTAIEELAKFHALSLIYEQQDKENFIQVKTEFHDIIFSRTFLKKTKLTNYFNESFEMTVNLVDNLKAKAKLESVKPKLLEIFNMYTKPGRTNVLCHGDYWVNNILFKHEENKPSKVCIIDFQATRYASPLTDILYFIFLCTDSTFRSIHLIKILDAYYSSLKSYLSLYSLEVDSIYTKEDFENDCLKFTPFGFLIAMVELRIMTKIDDKKDEDFVKSTDNLNTDGDMEYLKIRVNDLVNECESNGTLDRLVAVMDTLEDDSDFVT